MDTLANYITQHTALENSSKRLSSAQVSLLSGQASVKMRLASIVKHQKYSCGLIELIIDQQKWVQWLSITLTFLTPLTGRPPPR